METFAPLYAGAQECCQLPGGANILVDLDEHVQRWIYFFGVYEEPTVQWFRSALRPSQTVLDIGANVGQYTLIAASDVGPKGRVHSFEPNPFTYRRLLANIDLNGFRHVHAHPVALSDATGMATLYVPKNDNLGEASLQPCTTGSETTGVSCTTLDAWADTADLGSPPRIDLIKIDVQGFEAKVIQGAIKVLERFRPTIVCEFEERWLQLASSSCVELKSLFRRLEYDVYRSSSTGLTPVALDEVHAFENLILVPQTR